MTTTNDLISELVAARKAAGMSQAAVALRLGVSQAAISYWESGRTDVALVDFVRWAAVFGLENVLMPVGASEGRVPELFAGGLA